MNYLKYIFILSFTWANCTFAAGPDDDIPTDTIALDEVAITANRLVHFTAGAKIQKIDASEINNYQNENLSSLLSELTGISVKSYGASGVSSIALRGMSSKHTAVLWNGMNIQSNMYGGVDMNSMPSFLIDNISIQHGGASALYGSGAIGGTIHLNNNLHFTNNLSIQYNQHVGSFDNYFEGLKFKYSSHKFVNSTRFYHKYGKNDYTFVNTQQFGKPTDTLKNSANEQFGFMQSNAFKLNSRHKIVMNMWVQRHLLEIPATMSNTKSSEQTQDTDNIRASLAWNYNREKSSWFTRFYYNYQSQIYRAPNLDSLVSELDNSAFIGEIENKTALGTHFLFNAGINNTYDLVKTPNYGTTKERNRTSIYSSLKYFNQPKTLAITLSAREELIDDTFSPLTFSVSSSYFITDYLNINTNISKNYNIPTFNDLYWVPGGNPNLEAENGWSEDLGLTFQKTFTSHSITAEISAFNINLNNHVIWIPSDTASYWVAENVEEIWSRGMEYGINYRLKLTNFFAQIHVMYTYTKSTYEETEMGDEVSIGKQQMYVPVNKVNGKLTLGYKWLNLRYTHNFTDKRYINKDNSSSIPQYHLANIALGGKIKVKTSEFYLSFKVNNIWNKTYQVMANYAMPKRHYTISITYNFNKPLN